MHFENSLYSDIKVCEIAAKAIEFSFEHFKNKETIYEDYQYEFEVKITGIGLGIDSHLQKNKGNKKSNVIKKFVTDIINEEKYLAGRESFIFLLYILKMDNELIQIANDKKDFWKTPRIRFQLLYALYRRRINGFKDIVEDLIKNNPKDRELIKYAKKYIEQENK
ncbi:MAG: hypothetical protein CSB06_03405 [Bacteroidia bacterium]|nr:MAG: hypothetical protein CSB06_03405 [Bacteroidia bacterium]